MLTSMWRTAWASGRRTTLHRLSSHYLMGPGYAPTNCGVYRVLLFRALNAVPRQIPCLTLDDLQLPNTALASMIGANVKIGAEKMILRTKIDALAAIDDDCQTIVLRQCHRIHDICHTSLPLNSNLLEFGGCNSEEIQCTPDTRSWHGDMVTITNSHPSCINIILHFLGAPFNDHSCSLWPRVTMLKLVAKGCFVMHFPLTLMKVMVSSQREAAGLEDPPGKDDEELDSMGFEGVRPLMVLHVHGGPPLPRKERVWFKERVGDFV
ncbi:hypothetical protein EDB19DRAFT_1830562 [Suillus lakei]|nr:hypothetical protein EDB19DRAFT_1830562 [Suillus lakei]